MKPTTTKRVLLALFVSIPLTTGCVAMSEAEREAREYSRVDFRNQFIEDRDQCQASGGRIYIQAYGGALDNHGVPLTRVFYTCT